jgi:hypothetical protein
MIVIIVHRAYASTVTSPSEMAVLLSLADQANDEGIRWPSVGSISRRTRLGERTVQRALRSLADARHISVTGAIGGGAHKETPTYVIHPRATDATGDTVSPVSHSHPSTGDAESPHG